MLPDSLKEKPSKSLSVFRFVSDTSMIDFLAYLTLTSADSRVNPVDQAEMVFIPGGEFVMGSDPADIDRVWKKFGWPEAWKAHTKNEQPAHKVKVKGFWMYRDMVTVAQYRKFCKATNRAMPPTPEWGWHEMHPVVNVNWADAKAYCSWAKGRLPYEAEWEFAAQGGKGKERTIFVWGDDYPTKRKVANLADSQFKKSRFYNSNFHIFPNYDDGYTYTSPVAAYPANGYGLRDMAGNVWQWCEDWSDVTYYSKSPYEDPRGPTIGTKRIIRGGAFDIPCEIARLSRRVSMEPDVRNNEKGFRCVQD